MIPLKNQIAASLFRLGLSANFLTALGLFFAGLSAFLIYRGSWVWGAGVLLLSGLLDLLDGAVARAAGQQTSFGGILDSSLDRVGDFAVLISILFYCVVNQSQKIYVVLAGSALLGSFLISYVRARAECEFENCRVGFWERGERIVYISLALLVNNMALALWVLGIGTHLTAAQRLFSASRGHQVQTVLDPRKQGVYWAKVSILILFLWLYRLPLF